MADAFLFVAMMGFALAVTGAGSRFVYGPADQANCAVPGGEPAEDQPVLTQRACLMAVLAPHFLRVGTAAIAVGAIGYLLA